MLQDFSQMKWSLHGLLVSAFVQAGWLSSMFPVIEPRTPLLKPLDPSRYSKELQGKQLRNHIRFDVGFFKDETLGTFAEVNTIDASLEFEDSKGKDHVTKRDVYLHFAQNALNKASGLIICVTLPKNVTNKPPWPKHKSLNPNYYDQLKPEWEKLVQEIRKYFDSRLIVIEEKGILIDDHFHAVSIP